MFDLLGARLGCCTWPQGKVGGGGVLIIKLFMVNFCGLRVASDAR